MNKGRIEQLLPVLLGGAIGAAESLGRKLSSGKNSDAKAGQRLTETERKHRKQKVNNMAIRSDWNLSFEYDETDEEKIEEVLSDATAIAEDALGKFFEKKGIKKIAFSIDWDGDSSVEEGTLLREIGLEPPERKAA